MTDECCKNCKHIRNVKNFTGKSWEWLKICTIFLNEKDGWGMTVRDTDLCEGFEERKSDNRSCDSCAYMQTGCMVGKFLIEEDLRTDNICCEDWYAKEN